MFPDHMNYELDQPFLTIARVRDARGRRILLLHSDSLLMNPPSEDTISATLNRIRPCQSDTLVYLHGGIGTLCETTSVAQVRKFRAALDTHLRPEHIPAVVYALHVSFLSRTHAAVAARFAGAPARDLYAKTIYCDLVADLEQQLGIDCTLLGLRFIDLDYDEVMRCWVGRKDEKRSSTATANKPAGARHRRDNLSSGSLNSLASMSTQASSAASSSYDCYDVDEITPVFQIDNHIGYKPRAPTQYQQSLSTPRPKALDPSKPLIDVNNIYFDSATPIATPAQDTPFGGENI